ncbi:dixin-like isoform X2 [Saccostrea echinata]|uniref:dixin-like isoform X2 n=1 Tax=Saccostrea echinata TaxID=191078 RepID=UPI002A82322A|nr:dixin-like isoform X2 [Saccostrea echinata]
MSIMSQTVKQLGSPHCPNNPEFRRSDGNFNSLNQKSAKSIKPSLESRLSPRVKVGVELSILKSNSPMARDNRYLGGHSRESSELSNTPLPSTPSLTDTESDSNGMSNSNYDQKQNQLHAYVAWVNSQLKKKPGVRQIEDLRNDMRDGVAIAELIEIVSGEHLNGIHNCPSTTAEMRENVDRVLQYMAENRIRMHHTNAKDIVEGKLKSIMRLILALAAHFKPQCVKHSTHQRRPSGSAMTGLVQGASAALTEARRNAAKAGNSFRRNRPPTNYADRRKTYHGSSSDQLSDSDQSFGDQRKSLFGRDEGDGASADKSPIPSARVPSSVAQHPAVRGTPLSKSHSSDHISAKDSGTELEDSGSNYVERSHFDDLVSEYMEVYDDMKHTKDDLLKLQDLLLCGEPPDGEEGDKSVIIGSSPEEQIAILKSQLLQSTIIQNDLREDLSRTKNECMLLQGNKGGLQQRLSEQDETISQLKQEILRRDFDKQNSELEKIELRKNVQERDKTILDLKKDIARRDQRIDQLQNELQMQIQEKESITRALKQKISELHDRLRVVGEHGANLKAKVAVQDKRMAKLEGKILSSSDRDSSVSSQGSVDDHQVVRDALNSLRVSFKGGDPQLHTLETLEQSVSSLLEKNHQNNSTSSNGSHQNSYTNNSSRRINFDSTGDVRRSPITAIPGSTSFSVNQLDGPPNGNIGKSQNSTKVLYFTDKTVNPCMCTIHKRLGEITLKDFKKIHDKNVGNYRYSFKALDPEFGTVKEEVMNDDDIIPGWEGKIVAWIEEDTG